MAFNSNVCLCDTSNVLLKGKERERLTWKMKKDEERKDEK